MCTNDFYLSNKQYIGNKNRQIKKDAPDPGKSFRNPVRGGWGLISWQQADCRFCRDGDRACRYCRYADAWAAS